MLITGDREAQDGQVSVREHRRGDTGSVPVEAFGERLAQQVKTRARA
jgi:threonyl-tRNA synthetase